MTTQQRLPGWKGYTFTGVQIILTALFLTVSSWLSALPLPGLKNTVVRPMPGDTIVSGIVKDVNGKPIAHAKVTSTVSGDMYTNSDGLFSITLQKGNIIPQSFIFSYDTLMPVVRSYHPGMENAIYEIVLAPKKCCLRDLWAALDARREEWSLPPAAFMNGSAKLSIVTRTALEQVAAKLKEEPTAKIVLTAYPAANDPKQRVSEKRLEAITEFLVEQQGISSDRIVTEKKPGEGEGNTIDIKKQ